MGHPVLAWLKELSGKTTDELLSLEDNYRTDRLVCAFETAIQAKRNSRRDVTGVELIVLAVEALEREVNNGGYDQFFFNSSKEFAPVIVEALYRIGCPDCARITQEAIRIAESTLAKYRLDPSRKKEIYAQAQDELYEKCDKPYYSNPEPIGDRLFEFIKANREHITLP